MKEAHIQCSREDIERYAIIAGDPARIDIIKEYLENPEEIAYNREFKTIRGEYKGTKITASSTGIGGASAGIAIEELINCGCEYIIRIGSCGAIQENIDLGELVIGTGAVREDGASKTYVEENYPAVADFSLVREIVDLAEEKNIKYHLGLVRSHDSFYTDKEEEIMDYYHGKNVLGSDMETSILFTLGSLRGIKVASILNNVVLYKGNVKEGISDYLGEEAKTKLGEKNEIILALETFHRIDRA